MADFNRIDSIVGVIVAATGGDYDRRVPLEEHDDQLLEVEVGINFLLEELGARQDENEAQQRSLIEQSQQIAAQGAALVNALSTPIITLWPGVLALPIIGDFDSERATNTTAVLLERVASERASHVILDLTGVESIAADTAASLLGMVRSMGLLGVSCFVTGIHPHTAQQLVELDLRLDNVRTLARVSDALAFVLRDKRALR